FMIPIVFLLAQLRSEEFESLHSCFLRRALTYYKSIIWTEIQFLTWKNIDIKLPADLIQLECSQ
ncbi:hypothetical protein, partial [Oenococcus oeni]